MISAEYKIVQIKKEANNNFNENLKNTQIVK